MALNFDVSFVKNWKSVCYDSNGNMRPQTNAIIFGCLSTGIGEITEKTYREWFLRYTLMERAYGAGRNASLHLADVRAHIGLYTNVGRRTKAQFLSNVYAVMDREVAAIEHMEQKEKENGD